MTIFCCPKCQKPFDKREKSYVCENGHTYDRASSGYVNLLPPGGKQHGDDRAMLLARRVFLESGGYEPLKNALKELFSSLPMPADSIVLDAGCGEGYYTEALCTSLTGVSVYGIDVSKDAVKMCDNRKMKADFAAASVYSLPVAENSINLVLSVFSPFARQEFWRVMKSGGYLISVIPDTKHLWGLKSVLYDTPYENKVASYTVDGFTFLKMIPVSFTLTLSGREQILSLYRMTPYCYRTGKEGAARIEALDFLATEISFQILLYQKEP